MNSKHQNFLDIAYHEALKGAGKVSPNPRVGAVLVENSEVISKGHHEIFGQDHAEVNCLKGISDFKNTILYCTLEPCCHSNKKTAPCTQLIIDSKIPHVVIAELDANPEVSGKGVEILRQSGVKVEVIEHHSIKVMNEAFNQHITQKCRPYFHMKWAQTLDGNIATTSMNSKWITNTASRTKAHELRRMCDVIITSAGTIRSDDPSLTARLDANEEYCPIRIIITRSGDLPSDAKVLNDKFRERTYIFNYGPPLTPSQQVINFSHDTDIGESIQQWMHQNKYISALVEAGQELLTTFIKKGLCNRIHIFMAPKLIGAGRSAIGDLKIKNISNSLKFHDIRWTTMKEDLYFTALRE
jgi:diaminohydroxyphosphoribosylaminopyrimidine deaminase / 5-amino-6-(5-phosphoribosylamino)uracil reductase